jgi:hypothetical protein
LEIALLEVRGLCDTVSVVWIGLEVEEARKVLISEEGRFSDFISRSDVWNVPRLL